MDGANSSADLQEILANLSRFAPPTPTQAFEPSVNSNVHNTPTNVKTEQVVSPGGTHASAIHSQDPRLRPQSRSTASPKPTIDPATITTWQDGLRCVTKIAAQNAQFATSIRRMMEDQRRQEMRWYSERQALKKAQANRENSSAAARSILQNLSIGGQPTAPNEQKTIDVDVEDELTKLDRKIYDAQVSMDSTMIAELKSLGVPFFGTDEALIKDEEDAAPSLDDRPKWSPAITRPQLSELQKRMIQHLEDLYRD